MKQGTSNAFYLLGLVLLFYGITKSRLFEVVQQDAPVASLPQQGLVLLGGGVLSILLGLMGTVLRGR